MTEEQFKEINDELTSKLGKEKYGQISDTIGKWTTYNKEANERYAAAQKEVKSLKQSNEALIISNGNLLKQVPKEGAITNDLPAYRETDNEGTTHKYSFKAAFDEKGNFKR